MEISPKHGKNIVLNIGKINMIKKLKTENDFKNSTYLEYLRFVTVDILNKTFNIEILHGLMEAILQIISFILIVLVTLSFPISFPIITYFRWKQCLKRYNK